MIELTSPALLALTIALDVVVALVIVVLWTRAHPSPRGALRRLLLVAGRSGAVALAVLLGCCALALKVNDDYGFYTTWSDLLGQPAPQPDATSAAGLLPGTGRVRQLVVHGNAAAGVSATTLVWLPPQYRDPAYPHARFPVLYFLPGQTGPGPLFAHFAFGQQASDAIAKGIVKPFIGVFPPIVIAPPRDTECVNVPRGPQAESWLIKDVADAVARHFRTERPGPHWSIMGWSTGGYCAANLVLRNPSLFGAAVALGGDYAPYIDHTTGDLFGGDLARRNENTPEWLYKHNQGTRGAHLLMVAGKQDAQSWASTARMARLATGDPYVTLLSFPTGGHNFRDYSSQLPAVFGWLHRVGALQ